MRKSIPNTILILFFGSLFLLSCNNDEIDNLKKQVESLTQQVDSLGSLPSRVDTLILSQTDTVLVQDTVVVSQIDTLVITEVDTLVITQIDSIIVNQFDTIVIANDTILLSNLTIKDQESLDLFKERNIKYIAGELIIYNCQDITPLSTVQEIGTLSIDFSGFSNISLEGLNNLVKINKDFSLTNLPESVNFGALGNLEVVKDRLSIEGDFTSISSLNRLKEASIFRLISNNGSTTFSVNGFESLQSVTSWVVEHRVGDVIINGFPNLNQIGRLDNEGVFAIQSGGDITIQSFGAVKVFGSVFIIASIGNSPSGTSMDFTGLNVDYVSMDVDLFIGGGINLFDQLIEIGRRLNISAENDGIDGFENLQSTGSLDVSGKIVSGFINLETVNGDFEFDDYTYITNITNLQAIKGTLKLGGSSYTGTSLAELGLISLTEINGLSISTNSSITSLDGLNISSSVLYDRINLLGLNNLIDISALSTYCSGFKEANPTVSTQMTITRCNNLTNLDGLEAFTEAPKGIKITDNTILSDFCGIKPWLDDATGSIEIQGNQNNPQSSSEITGCN